MTLIEMIVTLVLIGIVGAAFAVFLGPAAKSFQAQTQRATLVDAAESALRRMARDIRIALPNSVRITNTGSGFALEMVPTVDGGRYCATGLADCSGASQLLDFSAADTDFDVLGCFRDAGFLGASGTSNYRLAIGNTGNEVYSGAPAVITPATTTVTLSTGGTCGVGTNRHHVALGAAFLFGEPSPRQRVFVIQASAAPLTYLCDTTAKTLTRYSGGYGFQASQPTTAAALAAASSIAIVASNVSACSVTSTTSNVQNTGIVILSLSLTDAVGAGETVTLVHEAPLDNSQ